MAAKLNVSAPTPRPGKGFSTSKAQSWILGCAMLTAVIYAFRLIIEPANNPTGAKSGSKAAQLAGKGSPPSLEHWAVAYTAAFLMLAMIATGAPELAASLALMATIGNLLNNGTTIVADIGGLEGAQAKTTPPTNAQFAATAATITGQPTSPLSPTFP